MDEERARIISGGSEPDLYDLEQIDKIVSLFHVIWEQIKELVEAVKRIYEPYVMFSKTYTELKTEKSRQRFDFRYRQLPPKNYGASYSSHPTMSKRRMKTARKEKGYGKGTKY